jgi:DNA-binding transcriptional LysR family regulator
MGLMRNFTLTQLRYFAVVAETESMTRAAERLLVSQSAVSTAMTELERILGTQLFLRNRSTGLRLTSTGRQFAAEVKPFLEHADALFESTYGPSEALTGELVVGVFSPLASFRLPIILQAFESRHPGVEVIILEADLATLHAALREGRCDLALMYGHGLGAEFTSEVLERVPPHAVVSADHPLANSPAQEVALRDLAGEPLILLDLPHSREYYESLFALAGVTPNIRHRFSGYETVRSFVARGHGYALLNQRVHNDVPYSGGRVVPLRLTDDLPPSEVMLVRLTEAVPGRRALAFESSCRRLYGARLP